MRSPSNLPPGVSNDDVERQAGWKPAHERIVGRAETPPDVTPVCIACGKPFKPGTKGEPGVNVYSKDGMREIAISGMCEVCFDEATLPEDECEECEGTGRDAALPNMTCPVCCGAGRLAP